MTCGSWVMTKNIINKTKVFDIFPVSEKTRKWGKNKKINHDNSWNFLYKLANYYMSGIFSSVNIFVQTWLGHYLYHTILIFVTPEMVLI